MSNDTDNAASLSPLITQCPNCTTRFKVTEDQLQAANGKVRCGACLGVFEATASLTQDGEPFRVDPGADLDDLLAEIAPASDDDQDAVGIEPQPDTELGPEPEPEVDQDADSEDALVALERELLAELQHETDPDASSSTRPATDTTGSHSEAEDTEDVASEHVVQEVVDEADDVPLDPQLEDDATQNAAEEAQDQTSEDTGAELHESDAHETDPDQVEEALDAGADTVEAEDHVDVQESEQPDELEQPEQTGQEQTGQEQIGQESVSAYLFDVPEDPPKPRRPVATLLLIVLAVLVLPAQVLWFQYETWVKDETYRPIYATLCQAVGCTLPPMKDPALIQSRKSISRSHPDKPDVRVVDVLMVNNAQFPQPFPTIELTFTNVDGQLVAGRRFQPGEYLHGELRNVELMQPRTPVHVSLELQDPGPTAQGFRVVFR